MSESVKEVGKLPRPKLMKGLLNHQIRNNIILTFTSCTIAALYMKYIYGDGNRKAYKDFYENYDIDKEFERMRKKGLFDSCDTD